MGLLIFKSFEMISVELPSSNVVILGAVVVVPSSNVVILGAVLVVVEVVLLVFVVCVVVSRVREARLKINIDISIIISF